MTALWLRFAAVTFSLAAGLACLATAQAGETCKLVQIASLPANFGPDRRIVVPASINGTELRFMVDTGAGASLLMGHIAEKLGLTVTTAPGLDLYGLGGEATTYKTWIREFKIGNSVGHEFNMIIAAEGADQPGRVDGILSGNFFSQFDVEIDLVADKINLFSQDHCDGAVVYWASSRLEAPFHLVEKSQIGIRVTLNDVEKNAILDTGAPSTLISWPTASDLGISEASPGIKMNSELSGLDGKSLKSAHYYLNSFEFAGEKLNRLPITIGGRGLVLPATTGSNLKTILTGSEVLVGINFFLINHVYIAYKEQKIYFTPYSAAQIKELAERIKN